MTTALSILVFAVIVYVGLHFKFGWKRPSFSLWKGFKTLLVVILLLSMSTCFFSCAYPVYRISTGLIMSLLPFRNAELPTKAPETRLLTFGEGSIVSFTYYGGLLVWDAQGGVVDFIDETGQHWEHTPGRMEIGIKNRKLHKGVIIVSKRAGSTATGVKITQVWNE